MMREVLRGRHLKEGVQGKPLCFRLGLGAHWDSEEKKGWAHIEADLTTFRTWLPKEVLDQLDASPVAGEEDEEPLIDWAQRSREEARPAYVFIAPISCWKCKRGVHFFFVRAESWMVTTESEGLFRSGVLSQLFQFQKRNPGRFQLGLVKKRFSKTVGGSYLSQGCPLCDALFGDFPLGESVFFYFADPRPGQRHFGFQLNLDQVIEDGGFAGDEHWIGAEECPIPVDPSADVLA